jgi:hypothetical protein
LLRRGIDLNRNSKLNNDLDQLAFWMQYYMTFEDLDFTTNLNVTKRVTHRTLRSAHQDHEYPSHSIYLDLC